MVPPPVTWQVSIWFSPAVNCPPLPLIITTRGGDVVAVVGVDVVAVVGVVDVVAVVGVVGVVAVVRVSWCGSGCWTSRWCCCWQQQLLVDRL